MEKKRPRRFHHSHIHTNTFIRLNPLNRPIFLPHRSSTQPMAFGLSISTRHVCACVARAFDCASKHNRVHAEWVMGNVKRKTFFRSRTRHHFINNNVREHCMARIVTRRKMSKTRAHSAVIASNLNSCRKNGVNVFWATASNRCACSAVGCFFLALLSILLLVPFLLISNGRGGLPW